MLKSDSEIVDEPAVRLIPPECQICRPARRILVIGKRAASVPLYGAAVAPAGGAGVMPALVMRS